ncbi:efflux RND transporter periplasmic adaptor subunit [Bacteroidota bacterium]
MKPKKIISAIYLIALVFSLNFCSGRQDTPSEIIRPVRYEKVIKYGGEQTRTFSGVSKSGLETNLSFKVGGTIKQLNVKVGDQIQAGKLIAVLDATDYNLQLDQTKAAHTQAEVQMQNLKSTYDRIAKLYETGSVSVNDYEQAKTAYESTKAGVNSARKQVQLAEQRVNYTRLRAPIAGRVANVNAEINENIMAGFSIITLSSGSDIEVTVGMPESFIAMVKEGDIVTVIFSSLANEKFSGIISEISYIVGSSSTTYPLTIKLENTSKSIRPGMTANVIFHLNSEDEKESILVPSVAVGEENDQNFVYVLNVLQGDTATVHKRIVTVGEITSAGFEILEGLEDGEMVVTAGISKLSEGLKVKILN